ncbi:MAG: fumarylacetoacetate hydrolase family protein [Burkholderiaceae bacterium]|nr:fumarylacetoacetate hydrolase family protein [Burkholderiaceae bacterium]
MTTTDALAHRLLAARRARQPMVATPDDGPADVAQAYEVQWRVTQALSGGRRIAHWKVGAASREQTPQAAPIPAPCVLPSPARWIDPPTTGLAIEAEVAFRVARDIDGASAATIDVADAFDCVMVAIEVCDTRLAAQPAPHTRWKLADALSNAGLVVGSGGHAPDAIDYSRLRCIVEVDGSQRFDAIGTHPLGDPRTLLPWWLAFASARVPLHAGDLVTTGSWCGMLHVAPGAQVVVQFERLGRAELQFAG